MAKMPQTKKLVRVSLDSETEGSPNPSTTSSPNSTPRASMGRCRTKNMTDTGAIFKAKWLFYNDNKNNKDIVNEWIGKRKAAGLPYQKPKVVNKQVVMVPDINFLDIKDATDLLWEKLNAREQKKYIDEAWALYNKKAH